MNLLVPVFKSVFKRRETLILMLFAFLPLLVAPLVTSDVVNDLDFTSSLPAFFIGGLETQFQIVLPTLILGLLVSSVFRDEINTGILFLYKDINRTKILNAKFISLLAVYALYFLASLVVCAVSYFTYISPKFGVAPRLLPMAGTAQSIFIRFVTILAFYMIVIAIVTAVSIRKSTIQAVAFGVLFTLLSMTAPLLNGIRYLFPNSYANQIDHLGFPLALAISLGLTVLYTGLAYRSARHQFNKVEF